MRLILILSVLLSAITNPVYTQSLSTKIDELIRNEFPYATIGVLIQDAESGQIIYRKNADKLLSPASNMKLFTAAATFYHFPPDYRFLTTLSQLNHDYYIRFSGSPTLTIDDLKGLILTLKEKGVREIKGDFILDVSRFQSPYYPGGTSYDDLGWYYSAPDSAVILNGNAASYQFISGKELGDPVLIKADKEENGLTIINQLRTVDKEEEKNHCGLNIEIKPNNTLRLFGCLAQQKDPKTLQLAIPNPSLLAKSIIKKSLAEQGITLHGTIRTGHLPAQATQIIALQSADLKQVVSHMLLESDNLYASSLMKQLAYSLTKEATYKQGAFAIKQILTQNTHLDMKQLELADGIGTRYNLVSALQIVTLLNDLYQDQKMRDLFLTTLPQSGVSGTLKDRMKKTILEKRVYAKTGTMHDVSSLSGYIIKPEEKSFIFSIIINGINQPIDKAKGLEEKILLAVVNELYVDKLD
ncbi:D-alanyl-D-alanine carboxypeptidase/D-alanyl-D-alanine-endopeptidase [Legionella waltersii]|uniref:D-Ala-D-Ala carboxypeptidase n=1 Tax=Legionella waltersii TaxID=66969 RepID=A0A0W1A5E0_9GAMM|nr:D-alanyl-D-alanine carboxypeptidase/D-alanyl-D-alanine-endopeptidase [Legionella waltersii]KTD76583.1 D-Ala-D-Ala carboxypeptidase [Legionella waltersii]SNU94461.1 D-Ala-D-Ala carboxypeptidase [Legionella waltersii]